MGIIKTMILYEGPSLLNKQPIVAIATSWGGSKNTKTGPMVQTYILPADEHPKEAIKNGTDESVCGNCPARGKWCYASQGPSGWGLGSIYRTYKRGKYPPLAERKFKNRQVRFGAFGDPAAVPQSVWEIICKYAVSWTGYTHQWKDDRFHYLQRMCMASVDSLEEHHQAVKLGWRTYRVTEDLATQTKGEVICPHYTTDLQCYDCGYCDGGKRELRGSVVVQAHGTTHKQFQEAA